MKNKPIIYILILCVAVSALLCGCGSGVPDHFPVAVSDETRSALELSTEKRADSELSEIYFFMCEGNNVKKLNDAYPIECLRRDDDGYHALYKGNKRLLVLHFDTKGNWIKTEKLNSLYRLTDTRGRFDKLSVGDSVTTVQSADPFCYFPFLVHPDTDRLVTYHYTEDGYVTTIHYDADFNITSVYYDLI